MSQKHVHITSASLERRQVVLSVVLEVLMISGQDFLKRTQFYPPLLSGNAMPVEKENIQSHRQRFVDETPVCDHCD